MIFEIALKFIEDFVVLPDKLNKINLHHKIKIHCQQNNRKPRIANFYNLGF